MKRSLPGPGDDFHDVMALPVLFIFGGERTAADDSEPLKGLPGGDGGHLANLTNRLALTIGCYATPIQRTSIPWNQNLVVPRTVCAECDESTIAHGLRSREFGHREWSSCQRTSASFYKCSKRAVRVLYL